MLSTWFERCVDGGIRQSDFVLNIAQGDLLGMVVLPPVARCDDFVSGDDDSTDMRSSFGILRAAMVRHGNRQGHVGSISHKRCAPFPAPAVRRADAKATVPSVRSANGVLKSGRGSFQPGVPLGTIVQRATRHCRPKCNPAVPRIREKPAIGKRARSVFSTNALTKGCVPRTRCVNRVLGAAGRWAAGLRRPNRPGWLR